MINRHRGAFHPELQTYARVLPRTLVTPLTVPVFRHLPAIRIHRTAIRATTVTLGSGLNVRVFRPPHGADGGAVLWMHGGGYLLGDARMDDALCADLACETETTVAAVDYRLAPEHPYPAALDDCYEALQWLSQHPDVDPARMAAAGASAGGGLAAALTLTARDRGEIPVAAQLLIYPMLDDRTGLHADPDAAKRRLWNGVSNRLGWSAYLGGTDPQSAVPARRSDLVGLAPAWIGVGTLDVLYDEAVGYARRLESARVPCQLVSVAGAFHGFDAVAPRSRVARTFVDAQCNWLRSVLSAT